MRPFSRLRKQTTPIGAEKPRFEGSSQGQKASGRQGARKASRDIYAEKALEQIPRLLSNQDRNSFSPTYGCFHRDYWLDKTSDFPDAVRQFAVHALALVYRHDFPNNPYRGQKKIRDWAIAGLDYWQKIQHRDGSFDEFYPFERGWVGPTAFTTFTSIEAFVLLRDEIPFEVAQRVLSAIRRAAMFIAAGESEEDHLANHHAMACLAVWKAYELLGDPALEAGFEKLWQTFLTYHRPEEGWSREYDGVDPGYLSATASFLGKILMTRPSPEMRRVVEDSARFAAYFVYPNGFYAGSLGSRNTLHFYPHGIEWLAHEMPLAKAMAAKMRLALAEGKLVPPGIISDRYVAYRVPEFLQAYLDSAADSEETPANRPAPAAEESELLPYQRTPFVSYFEQSRIFVSNDARRYVVANLSKGGVVKVFDRRSGELLMNDCGLIGKLADGRVVTSQWVDPDYRCEADEQGFVVRGRLQLVPSNKLFSPFKLIIFRSVLICIGWSPKLSHKLKASIRKTLILGRRPIDVAFTRLLRLREDGVDVVDEIAPEASFDIESLSVGGEFFVRYVPQSRYFQFQELTAEAEALGEESLQSLRAGDKVELRRSLEISAQEPWPESEVMHSPADLPEGVLDADYHQGRQQKSQQAYRLQRRTEEVAEALDQYSQGSLDVVVDVGTADGLMLEALCEQLEIGTAVGVDLSLPLLETMDGEARRVRGDAADLPIAPGAADAVVSTAVIEHVDDAAAMLGECARILRPGGLLVLTASERRTKKVASLLGFGREKKTEGTWDSQAAQPMLEESGFDILGSREFMLSPIGFSGEKKIEKVLRPLGLSFLMATRLVVARRRS